MQLRGVDTNLIVALRALLEHRNVTRAARDVGLTQSSMSHALARLRTQFGDPLLVPVGRQLVLTERAKDLRLPVDAAIAQLERVFARNESFDKATSRRVFRIAAPDNVAMYILPSLTATLRAEAPAIDLRVGALSVDWMNELLRGDIDLKLGRKYRVPSTLESEDLSREELACVVRRSHPVGPRPTLQEYAALDHVVVAPIAPLGSHVTSPVDDLLSKHGLRRRVVLTVPHFLVAPAIVARADLALTAPSRLLEPLVRPLGLRRVTVPLKLAGYTLSQVWSARSRDDAALRWLRETIARSLS